MFVDLMYSLDEPGPGLGGIASDERIQLDPEFSVDYDGAIEEEARTLDAERPRKLVQVLDLVFDRRWLLLRHGGYFGFGHDPNARLVEAQAIARLQLLPSRGPVTEHVPAAAQERLDRVPGRNLRIVGNRRDQVQAFRVGQD